MLIVIDTYETNSKF